MSERAQHNPAIRWPLVTLLLALLASLGCSAASSTVDSAVSGAAMTLPSAVTAVASDAGLPPAASATTTVHALVDSPDAGLSETPPATAVSPQALSFAIAPTLDRSYLLPLGDRGTNRRAMATKYAELTPVACRAELRRRRISVTLARSAAAGIVDPMRLAGPLRDVRFITPGPRSVNGLLDCRMVLLLDELASVLAREGVSSIYVDGFYRPRAHLPGKKAFSQHAFGLAIDIHGFGTKDGRTLLVERDFGGQMGTPVCGNTATIWPESKDSVDLRNIVCAMARPKAFHYLLTPNHDQAHSNHVHGDIKRGAREHVVR